MHSFFHAIRVYFKINFNCVPGKIAMCIRFAVCFSYCWSRAVVIHENLFNKFKSARAFIIIFNSYVLVSRQWEQEFEQSSHFSSLRRRKMKEKHAFRAELSEKREMKAFYSSIEQVVSTQKKIAAFYMKKKTKYFISFSNNLVILFVRFGR